MIATGANRQPAAATYLRPAGESVFRFSGVHVLDVERGTIAAITTFGPELCGRFSLPPTL
jgi:RNA polymerase sigma-70 factor (ECF subfamily)